MTNRIIRTTENDGKHMIKSIAKTQYIKRPAAYQFVQVINT